MPRDLAETICGKLFHSYSNYITFEGFPIHKLQNFSVSASPTKVKATDHC